MLKRQVCNACQCHVEFVTGVANSNHRTSSTSCGCFASGLTDRVYTGTRVYAESVQRGLILLTPIWLGGLRGEKRTRQRCVCMCVRVCAWVRRDTIDPRFRGWVSEHPSCQMWYVAPAGKVAKWQGGESRSRSLFSVEQSRGGSMVDGHHDESGSSWQRACHKG